MDYGGRRFILLTDWYMKHWEQQDDFNQMVRQPRRWWIRPINQRRNDQGDGEHLL